jgi:hypothetical protein
MSALTQTFPLEGEGYAALATQSPRRSWMRGAAQRFAIALQPRYPHPASPKFAALIKASQPSPCTGEGSTGEGS